MVQKVHFDKKNDMYVCTQHGVPLILSKSRRYTSYSVVNFFYTYVLTSLLLLHWREKGPNTAYLYTYVIIWTR